MKIHLVDGTYELFRAHFGAPSAKGPGGQEVGAARGLVRSLLALLHAESVTHVACAFDTVIESFRNQLYAGYKTGEGVPEELRAQFPLAERATRALGIVVWPMLEFETDDALATIERAHIIEVLHREQGNKSRAARALGINRRSLYRLIEKFGIGASELTEN